MRPVELQNEQLLKDDDLSSLLKTRSFSLLSSFVKKYYVDIRLDISVISIKNTNTGISGKKKQPCNNGYFALAGSAGCTYSQS